MNKQISKFLCGLSIKTLIILSVVANLISGYITAQFVTNEANIISQFNMSFFVKEIKLILIYFVSLGIARTIEKSYRTVSLNSNFRYHFEKVSNSKIKDINNTASGKLFDTIRELGTIQNNIITCVIGILPTLMPFVALVKNELQQSMLSGIVSIVAVIVCFLLIFISDNLFHWNTEYAKRKGILQAATVDCFNIIKTIKFLHIGNYAKSRLIDSQNNTVPYSVAPLRVFYYRIVDVISFIPLLLNIYIFRNNQNMLSMVLLSNYLIQNMTQYLSNIAELLIDRKANLKNIENLKGDDTTEKPILTKDIELNNVEFCYNKDSVQFYIENLTFKKNERYLIYGESGEGKSSLANLLSGAVESTVGEVPKFLSYYVWQETESMDDTLINNIVFDNPYNVTNDEILEMFKELNMLSWFLTLPDGFDTMIGERGCKLSSGQKQRLNIIRVLINMKYKPEYVFILDEITSNLDNETKKLAINMIDKYCKSTLICISHNEGFDKICMHQIEVKDHKFNCIN